MYSQEELSISNKSYINKDFPAIYNELLDTAQKISYKYDPTTSNESDPMIVLIKLIALAGDKLNYNVDKNILERFITSITQWNAMQERTSTLGYKMHYYRSAEGIISMKYNSIVTESQLEEMGDLDKIRFPAFSTKLTNSSNNTNYVLVESIEFIKNDLINNIYKTGKIIQGEIKYFTTLSGDQSLVTIDDLDDFNRLYFPEAMVAENGVFIEQENSFEDWKLVDNLNTQVPQTKCFIFNYDSVKKLPYIQFPDDISSLIEGGLKISYIITNGENGNVGANNIDSLTTNGIASFELEDADLLNEITNMENYFITNPSALSNGENIEDIDSAYFNFQKTVGTFDTLVACRDYANYIYNLSDEDFKSLVSNVQVCDRRDDFNYSTKITTFNEFGQSTLIKVNQVSDGGTTKDEITAFDLMLYPLQPLQTSDITSYENSFRVLSDTALIQRELEATKCLSHNYKQLKDDDVYAFKNYYKLNAKVTTTYKVNQLEQNSIKKNIREALINNFNARKVDYGYEIPYDTILKVIENADSRIKFVSLDEPKIDTKLLLANNTEVDLNSIDSTYIQKYKIPYIAKNILAGRVSLYDYDDSFKYNFGQKSISSTDNVDYVSTCAKFTLTPTEKTLQDNEVIQLFTPSFINGREWNYGWFYDTSSATLIDETKINEEQVIALGANDFIKIYPNSKGNIGEIVLKGSTSGPKYIKVKGITNHVVETVNDQTRHQQINSGANIVEQDLNKVTLDEPLYLYWITNNIKLCGKNDAGTYSPLYGNSIECSYIDWGNNGNNNEYILLDGEYLYVTDRNYSYLYAYGPGTKIERNNVGEMVNAYLPLVNTSEVDLNSLKDKFKQIEFNNNSGDTLKQLYLYEQSILTLIKGDSIKISDSEADDINLYSGSSGAYYNRIQKLTESIYYSINNGESGTVDVQVAGIDTFIRARLDLNISPNKAQELKTNQEVYAHIITNNNFSEYTTGDNLNSKYAINVIGGKERLIKYYSFIDNEYVNNSIYKYIVDDSATDDISNPTIAVKKDNYYRISVSKVIGGTEEEPTYSSIPSTVSMNIPLKSNQDTLVMVYVKSLSSNGEPPLVINKGVNISKITDTNKLKEGINILKFSYSDGPAFTITFNKDDPSASSDYFEGVVIIGEPRILLHTITDSYNSNLGLNTSEEGFLSNYINNYRSDFYYNLILNNSYVLDERLDSDYSLFNSNNIANKITIPEIDINYAVSNIDIAKSSQL